MVVKIMEKSCITRVDFIEPSVISLQKLLLGGFFTGCSDIGRGLLNELEDNQEGIKSELSELKDGLKAEINEWMGFASKYAITKDKDLKGERKLG